MAYDALREATPSRPSQEYLKILKLAAEGGEVQVDEALRELLDSKAETAIYGGVDLLIPLTRHFCYPTRPFVS